MFSSSGLARNQQRRVSVGAGRAGSERNLARCRAESQRGRTAQTSEIGQTDGGRPERIEILKIMFKIREFIVYRHISYY